MESLRSKRQNTLAITALSALVLTGCSIDSYLTDSSNVQCDGKRTKADLGGNGTVSFIVHGTEDGSVATVKVRRSDEGVSVGVDGDVSGPPQQLEADGFTSPVPLQEGSELTAFGAGGGWVVDVRDDSVVIQGSCEGM